MPASTTLNQLQISSYSWAVANSFNPGPSAGGSGEKPTPQTFNFTANLSNASPSLLTAVATGATIPNLELDSFDAQGRKVTTWHLTNAHIVSYQAVGVPGQPQMEQFSMQFGAIAATYTDAASTSGIPTTTHWNYATNVGDASLSIVAPAITTATSGPEISFGPGKNFAVQSFNWDETNSVSTGGTAGLVASKVQFGEFQVQANLNALGIDLLSYVNSGKTLPNINLAKKDAQGKMTAFWTLQNVAVTSLKVAGAGNPNSAIDSFTLKPTQVTESVYTPTGTLVSRSWNTATNTGTGFSNFSDLPPLAPGARLVLNLGNGKQIAINAFDWASSNQTGKPQAGQFEFSANLGLAAPDLFAAIASSTHFPTLELDSYNAQGQQVASWKLQDAIFTDDAVSASATELTDSFKVSFGAIDFSQANLATPGSTSITTPTATQWNYITNTGSTSSGSSSNRPVHGQNLLGTPGTHISFGVNGDLSVDAFAWSATNASSIGLGATAGTDKAQFGEFQFSTTLSSAIPDLVSLLNAGTVLPKVTIYNADVKGRITDEWVLENVVLTSNQLAGNNTAIGLTDNFTLKASKVTDTVFNAIGQSTTRSWDVSTNTGDAFKGFNDLVQYSLPGSANALNLGNNHLIDIQSYSWAVSNNSSSISAASTRVGTAKAQPGKFTFTTNLGALSPDLLTAIASGAHLPTLELDSTTGKGIPTTTWKLTNAVVTSFQTSESAGQVTDTFTVSFDKLAIAYASKLATATTSWDYVRNTGTPAASVHGQNLQNTPGDSLSFGIGHDLAIQSFSWGESSLSTSNAPNSGTGKVQFGNFTFTTAFSAGSVDLTALVNSSKHLPEVTFSEVNAQGKLVSQWILDNVVVASNQISAVGNQISDTFTLAASKVTEKVFDATGKAIAQSWDLTTNTGTAPNFGNLSPVMGSANSVLTFNPPSTGFDVVTNSAAIIPPSGSTQFDVTAGLSTDSINTQLSNPLSTTLNSVLPLGKTELRVV